MTINEQLAALGLDRAELSLLVDFGHPHQPFSVMQGSYGAYQAGLLCAKGLVRRTIARTGYYEYELTELGARLWPAAGELRRALIALADGL